MAEKGKRLTKKELIELLEPYDDNTNIVFGVNLQQGYTGFYDLTQDTNYSNSEKVILTSKALDKWYKEDIDELKEDLRELKK